MRILLAGLLSLTLLQGCAMFQALDPSTKSVLQGGTSITATVPVSIKQEYTVETTYNAAMKVYREYLRLPRCAAGASMSLAHPCRDPGTVAALKKVRLTIVEPALARARVAQRNGVSATDILSDTRQAIVDWASSIPIGGR